MSEWISKAERERFDAWKDAPRMALGGRIEEMILDLTKFMLHTEVPELNAEVEKAVQELRALHRHVRGRKNP